jgi:hypothetical protein
MTDFRFRLAEGNATDSVCLKDGQGLAVTFRRRTGRGRLWWAGRRTAGGSSGLTLSPLEYYFWIRLKMRISQFEQILFGRARVKPTVRATFAAPAKSVPMV